MAVSIRDVAQAAGVSVTTVSHALNGKGRVLPETRAHVLKTATELGYRPNQSARGLRMGRTGALGLCLPGGADGHRQLFDVDYYLEVSIAAVRAAFDAEQALVMLPPLRAADDLRRFAIDGGIVVSTQEADPRIDVFDALELPVVTMDRDLTRPDYPWWVAADTEGNTRLMLDHLASVGASRIALLTVDVDWTWFIQSATTFTEWSREQGRKNPVVRLKPDRQVSSAARAAGKLLDRTRPPDAIFAMSQWVATGALRAARQRGLKVPDDLLVAVGVDSNAARNGDPPLTALDLRPADAAARAVDLLLARVTGEDEEDLERSVPAHLRVRTSTTP